MASTSERMLRLLSLLQTHRYWPGPELATRLDVSERTLRRDVERLRDLGYDVDAARGVAGGYQLRAGKAVPPLLLDNDEALAIAIGLQAAAVQTLDGDGDAALRALTKVVSVLPASLRAKMDAFQQSATVTSRRPGPNLDTATLTTLSQACRDRMPARFGYTAADDTRTDRFVEPHALVALDTRWYLVAFDRDRDDWRTFRLDRIEGVETSTLTFRPREVPGGDALEYVRGNTRGQRTEFDLDVTFHVPGEQVAGFVGHWGRLTPTDEGCRWRATGYDEAWITALLVASDVPLTVHAPESVRARLARAGDRFATAGA